MSAYNYLLDVNNLLVSKPTASSPTKDQARSTALASITVVSDILDHQLFGARYPPTASDAIIKLFARRLRLDEVTLRHAKKVIDGIATKEEDNWFKSLVVCFDGMVERDVKRARRRIAKEPILTEKGKDILKDAVWYSNFWERYMDLPRRSTSKRRNNKLADLLILAMEKAEKKGKKAQEAEEKAAEQAKKAPGAGKTKEPEADADAEYEMPEEAYTRWKAANAVDDVDKPEALVVEAEATSGQSTQQALTRAVPDHETPEILIVEAKQIDGGLGQGQGTAGAAGVYIGPYTLAGDTKERKEAAVEKKRQLLGDAGQEEDGQQKIRKLAQSVVMDGVYR